MAEKQGRGQDQEPAGWIGRIRLYLVAMVVMMLLYMGICNAYIWAGDPPVLYWGFALIPWYVHAAAAVIFGGPVMLIAAGMAFRHEDGQAGNKKCSASKNTDRKLRATVRPSCPPLPSGIICLW